DTLSTGEARRVLVARALVHRPRVLVLDEPTRGLDLVARHLFLDQIRSLAQEGVTMLLVTHHVEEIIPEIERVLLLSRGTIAFDGAKADALTPAMLDPVFGAELTVGKSDGFYSIRVE